MYFGMILDMKTYTLREYIKKRDITQTAASKELGITKQYFSVIVNGRPAGRVLALRIEAWSEGRVKAANLIKDR